MSLSSFWADKPLGYAQFAAASIDTSTLVSSATFTSPGGAATAGIPKGTQLLLVQCETVGVRWRDDGQAPTTTVGYQLAVGAELRYTASFAALRLIGTAANAIVNIVAYG